MPLNLDEDTVVHNGGALTETHENSMDRLEADDDQNLVQCENEDPQRGIEFVEHGSQTTLHDKNEEPQKGVEFLEQKSQTTLHDENKEPDDYFNYKPEKDRITFEEEKGNNFIFKQRHHRWNSSESSSTGNDTACSKDSFVMPPPTQRQSSFRRPYQFVRSFSTRTFNPPARENRNKFSRTQSTRTINGNFNRSYDQYNPGIPPHPQMIRNNSVFGKQSIANVRLEDATSRIETSVSVWIIILTAAATYTLHGFSNSITNGIITDKTFIRQFPQTDTSTTTGNQKSHKSTIQGVTVGSYQVGCALGAFLCFFLTDRIGRKKVIHLLGIANCIGIVSQCTAFTLPHLIIGRIVMGLGVGAGHATFPLYLAECVTSRIRGRAIIACAVGGNFGHFIGAAIEIAFYFVKKSAQWRVPVALELVWAIASAVLPFWCPESPRYLLMKHRVADCIKAQSLICGLPEDDEEVIEEVKALEGALKEAGACGGKAGKKPARSWYRVSLGVFIQIMSSMSGIDVVTFFSTQTFEDQSHFTSLISLILTMGLQACQWLFSTLSIFFIDTLGRRPLSLFCAATMMVAMGCSFGFTMPNSSEQMLKAALSFYFFTMCAYPVGYHLIPSMYVAEVSPGNVRHQVCAFTGCIHFLCDFLVALITPVAFSSIGSRYYLVYCATNALTLLAVFFSFVETKGLELETIDEIFEFSPSYLELVKFGKERAEISKEILYEEKP